MYQKPVNTFFFEQSSQYIIHHNMNNRFDQNIINLYHVVILIEWFSISSLEKVTKGSKEIIPKGNPRLVIKALLQMTMETEDATDRNNAPITPICILFISPIFSLLLSPFATLQNLSIWRERNRNWYADERKRMIVECGEEWNAKEIYEVFILC